MGSTRFTRDAEQPLKEAIVAVQEEIDALFEAGEPDPAAVGALFITRRDLGEQLLEVHLVYHEDFVLLLDENQARKLRFMARADDVQKFIPAFKLFELIPETLSLSPPESIGGAKAPPFPFGLLSGCPREFREKSQW